MRLEQGIESLKLIPYYQGCELAQALMIPYHIWNKEIMSDSYQAWQRSRMINYDSY